MEHGSLFLNVVAALAAAFLGAVVAARLGQSLLIGYIVAGIAIGPYTPGFVADQGAVAALAEVGIIFLLFSVGIDLSLRDLLRAGPVAIVGALVQIAVTLAIGFGAGLLFGWQPVESLFFGAAISLASTTVISKVLAERGQADSDYGRLAYAWSMVQDLATIILVVVLSALARGGDTLGLDLAWALGRAVLFLGLLIPVGLFILPRMFEAVATFRNREVFILAIGVVVLGASYLSSLFGVSVALGAFVAGILVSESDLSHHILGEIQPLRDILSGLFFVSVGMLVDPLFVIQNLPLVLVTLVLIVGVKGVLTAGLLRAFGVAAPTALFAGAILAPSAEFSFLLASVGANLGALGTTAFNAMLAGAALSTVLAPSLMAAVTPLALRLGRPGYLSATDDAPPVPAAAEPAARRRHAIICGYGRIGQVIAEALDRRGLSYVVIEEDPRITRRIREGGAVALTGSAEHAILLEQAGLAGARVLIVAIPDALAARRIVEQARRLRSDLDIMVRTHSLAELARLRERGANEAILGELELALEMTRHTLRRFGVSGIETTATVNGLRERASRAADSGTDDAFWT